VINRNTLELISTMFLVVPERMPAVDSTSLLSASSRYPGGATSCAGGGEKVVECETTKQKLDFLTVSLTFLTPPSSSSLSLLPLTTRLAHHGN
jgi:hypothetical protein